MPSMAFMVCGESITTCDMGLMPSVFNALPDNMVMIEGRPAGNILDFIEFLNIEPFGLCVSLLNPEVDIATAAALGVLVPMPCEPIIITPWLPGAPTVLVGGLPALTDESVCFCLWGGMVEIDFPGQVSVITE